MKKKYQIRTIAAGGLSVFVGGSATTFEIQEIDTGASAYYTLFGADFGVGFKAGGAQGVSSWTAFQSNASIKDFHGYVIVKAASANLVVGVGGMDMDFITGPAAGLKINGVGWSTGLGASINATHGWMKYRGD